MDSLFLFLMVLLLKFHSTPAAQGTLQIPERLVHIPVSTVCPGSSDPFHIVSYYIQWVTTSWTYSTNNLKGMINEKLYSQGNFITNGANLSEVKTNDF